MATTGGPTMFRPDGFQLPFGHDDEPGEPLPDEPSTADDPPRRSWFWPAFWIGLVLVVLVR